MDWGRLYQENFTKVFAFVFSLCGNKAISEDITQDTFLKAYRNIDNFREECRLTVWLNKIAYHQLLDYKKKKANQETTLELETVEQPHQFSISLQQELEQKLMSECIQSKINMLPENYKAVVFLDMQGYSNTEIANILDSKLHNVKARLNRGRNKLREILGNACGFYYDERNVFC